MAHTPGPWKVITQAAAREVDVFEVAEISHFRVIPDRPDTWSTCGDAYSDAKLIAAAPDLLEALQSVWLWMENQADAQSKGGHATFDLMALREQRDIARAAIAKATGEQ